MPANPEEANVTLRVPHDVTVWGTARWWDHLFGGSSTMDPVIVSQDLSVLPGGDDGGAPHRLKEWIALSEGRWFASSVTCTRAPPQSPLSSPWLNPQSE